MIKISFNKNVVAPWNEDKIAKIVKMVARYEKKVRGEVEVNLVTESEIKKINKNYRGINKVTDVLSFAWQEDKMVKTDFLGQIYLCYPKIKTQAKLWGVTVNEELARMLVHGLLHLVGFDHQQEKESAVMFNLQEKIVKKLCQSTV